MAVSRGTDRPVMFKKIEDTNSHASLQKWYLQVYMCCDVRISIIELLYSDSIVGK